MVAFRSASLSDRPRIAAFYARTQYGQALTEDETLLVAEQEGKICGALRLCQERGVLVLRGMRVAKDHQRKGMGSQFLLRAAEVIGGRECFCIPHRHLAGFYQQVGFSEIDPASAPGFLADRLASYRRELDLEVILMKRTAKVRPDP